MNKYCLSNLALLCGLGTAILLYSGATGAKNQDGGSNATAPADGVVANADRTGVLDTIVVTAQRREENLQSVPIAVTALDASTVARFGPLDTTDLGSLVPGLTYTKNITTGSPFIRGSGTPSLSAGDEASVATYVDGVYIQSFDSTLTSLANVERIEVLRGPQGTLFGRNATGGVINIVTRQPEQSPEFDVRVGYGNFETYQASLFATGGVAPGLAASIAGHLQDQNEGWGDDLSLGREAHATLQRAFQGKVQYSRENIELTFSGDYERTKSSAGVQRRLQEGSIGTQGFSTFPGFYNVMLDAPSVADAEQWGGSVHANVDYSWARLGSISAYREYDGFNILDTDGTPINRLTSIQNKGQTQFSQEFQLQSLVDSDVVWIVGFYYLNAHGLNEPITNNGIIFPPDTLSLIFADLNTRSYAPFGQVTFPVSDETNLTAGLRYTIDEQHLVARLERRPGGVTGSTDDSETYRKLTWRFAVDHHVAPDTMIYASYNRGFKSGVFSTVSVTNPPVEPIVLDAYEIGLKTSWLNDKANMNISAFWYEYDDIQLNSRQLDTTFLLNAASAELKGVEVELIAAPTRNFNVFAGLAYHDGEYTSFPDAPITSPLPTGGNAVLTGDLSGNQMIRTPEWTFTGRAKYAVDTSIGELALNASYAFNSGFPFEADNRVRQPSYGLLNLSAGLTFNDDRWEVQLWGRNITDERYYLYGIASTSCDCVSPAAPATYGFTVGFHY